MTSTNAERTIDELPLIFATHGLPEEVASDNGPQFTSIEFAEFMQKNGIKHTLVPPYHPQSNGAAERSVRVVMDALVKQVLKGKQGISMRYRLANFLFRCRTTPQSTTGVIPAELMVKGCSRTRLSLIKPNLAQAVENKQEKQQTLTYKDLKCKRDRTFARNDRVRVRNTRANSKTDKWILGTVIKVCGPQTYEVRTGHKTRYVHNDDLIRAHDEVPGDFSEPEVIVPELSGQTVTDIDVNPPDGICNSHANLSENEDSLVSPTVVSSPPTILRRSQRVRKPVVKRDL